MIAYALKGLSADLRFPCARALANTDSRDCIQASIMDMQGVAAAVFHAAMHESPWDDVADYIKGLVFDMENDKQLPVLAQRIEASEPREAIIEDFSAVLHSRVCKAMGRGGGEGAVLVASKVFVQSAYFKAMVSLVRKGMEKNTCPSTVALSHW